MNWLKQYGDTEGPLGFPCSDAQAKALDELLQKHPEAEYTRLIVPKATGDLAPGERADVSWISTEEPDRQREVVLARGMDDSHFRHNPIVTLNHDYWRPPVGKSLWRMRVKEGEARGVKAKTVYPERPAEWTEPLWPADQAWALIKSRLMLGKSIGFLSLDASAPTEAEVKKNPDWADVRRVIRKWALLEYACCWMPVNQSALVEAVAKSLITPDQLQLVGADHTLAVKGEEPTAYLTEADLQAALARRLASIDVAALIQKSVEEALAIHTGKV